MEASSEDITAACFVAGTLVHTLHGLLAIENFVGGEQVLARNEETHEIAYRTVLGTKVTEEQLIYRVVIGNGMGTTETLRTTAQHPFWISQEGWKKASLLKVGDLLLDLNWDVLTVLEAEPQGTIETVYSIEVAEFRTFHVGDFGIWTHNVRCRNRVDRFITENGNAKRRPEALVPDSCIESAEFIIQTQLPGNDDMTYQHAMGSDAKGPGVDPVYALFGDNQFIDISNNPAVQDCSDGLIDHPSLAGGNLPGLGEGIVLLKSTSGEGEYNMHFGAVVAEVSGSRLISDMSEPKDFNGALARLKISSISSPNDFRGNDYPETDFAMGLLTCTHPGAGWNQRN